MRQQGPSIGRSGLTSQVYEALKEQILDQTIAPGARINIDQLRPSSASVRARSAKPWRGFSQSGWSRSSLTSATPRRRSMTMRGSTTCSISAPCWKGWRRLSGAPQARARDPARKSRGGICRDGSSGLGQHYRKYRPLQRRRRPVPSGHRRQRGQSGLRSGLYRPAAACALRPPLPQPRHRGGSRRRSRARTPSSHAFRDGDGEAARNAIVAHLEAGRSRLLKSCRCPRPCRPRPVGPRRGSNGQFRSIRPSSTARSRSSPAQRRATALRLPTASRATAAPSRRSTSTPRASERAASRFGDKAKPFVADCADVASIRRVVARGEATPSAASTSSSTMPASSASPRFPTSARPISMRP